MLRPTLAAAVLSMAASVLAQQPPPPSTATFPAVTRALDIDSGPLSNPTGPRRTLWSRLVACPGGDWMQLHFAAGTRLPPGSELRLTSSLDRAVQQHDADSLATWRGWSAAFNGDTVRVELVADPGVRGARVVLDRAERGVPSVGLANVCGTDDRTQTNDPRVGRLVNGCTGFVVFPGVLLTAGSCVSGGGSVVEFDVPLSSPTGSIVRADPDDQYPFTVIALDASGPGSDWAVCEIGPNSNTGLLPSQANPLVPLGRGTPAMLAPGATLRVDGFGTTVGTPLPAAWNFTQMTDTGMLSMLDPTSLCYAVDVRAGNAGSPVYDEATGLPVAIHTHGGCATSGCNVGTRIDLPALGQALAPFDPSIAAFEAYGSGCPPGAAFYEDFDSNNDLDGTSIQLTPVGAGYRVETCPSACFEPSFGMNIQAGDETLSGNLALGFAFQAPGGISTSAIRVASNGWISLQPGTFSSADFTPSVSELLMQGPRIAALWDDLDASSGGGGDVFFNTFPGRAVVTFDQVAQWNVPNSSNTFQVQLEASGIVKLYYGPTNSSDSPIVGYSPGNLTTDPGPVDLTALPVFTGSGLPKLTLATSGPPQLGTSVTLTLGNLPANTAAASLAIGFLPASIDLTPFGAAGCRLLNTAEGFVALPAMPGSTQYVLPVPNLPLLTGLQLYFQGLAIAPGLTGSGIASSNGLRLRFGT